MNPYDTPGYPEPQQPYSGPEQAQPQGSTSYWRCVLAALVCLGALVAVLLVALGLPSPRAGGQLVGSLVVPLFLSALVTWLIFRRKLAGFWILVLVSLPSFVLLALFLGVLRVVGRG